MIEKDVIIHNDIDIGATVACNDDGIKKPVVVLIMGTGKTDRDGNSRGFKSDFYKNLSDMFVEFGFICIRYDKRGTHKSGGNLKTCGLTDLLNDAANVVEYAKKLPFANKDKITVCGHSEGALIATLLTKKEKLCGLILLGGGCMSLKEALLYQNRLAFEQAGSMSGFLGWYLRKVLSLKKIDKQVNDLFEKAQNCKKLRYFYNGAFFSTKYMKQHSDLTGEEYADILKKFDGKILAITGTADVQADCRCLSALSTVENATVYTPENVNHILRETDGRVNFTGLKKEYKRLLKNDIYSGVKEKIKIFSDGLQI